MVWLLQRKSDVLLCEIDQPLGSNEYEFKVAAPDGRAETIRFGSATELIRGYLRHQSALQAEGWRPRAAALEHRAGQ